MCQSLREGDVAEGLHDPTGFGPKAGRVTMAPHLSPVAATLLHDCFHRSADQYPDRPAVVCGSRTLSYADVDGRANRLARHLRTLGVGRGSFVGLLLERSAEVPITILAILKAGAAYVPLDPDYPADLHPYW